MASSSSSSPPSQPAPAPTPKPPTSRLLTLRELPAWMRDNDYLTGAYRPHLPSLRACFHSAFFSLNNDTINVWSHTLGFLVFLVLTFRILGPLTSAVRHLPNIAARCAESSHQLAARSHNHLNHLKHLALPSVPSVFSHHHLKHFGLPNVCIPKHDLASLKNAVAQILSDHRNGILPLLFAACFCLLASTVYHAFWVYSPLALHFLAKLDFLGISVLCCGHGVSGIFYIFYCAPHLARPYYWSIAVAELVTVAAIFAPGFSTPKARPIRTLVFCALGSCVLFPIVHAGSHHDWVADRFPTALMSAMSALSTYFVGAVIYVSRFPECCRVGRHDRFFASHQLMHIAVIFGAALHLKGCYTLMQYRLEQGCAASPFLGITPAKFVGLES